MHFLSCLLLPMCLCCCTSASTVPDGLKWLALQQADDGSWSSPPVGSTWSELEEQPDMETTSLTLLSFLAAGQLHTEGTHKSNVQRGLDYLVRKMEQSEALRDLRDGKDMRAHGIAAWTLCEAYAVNRDKKLLAPAQLAVRFTENAQNPQTGGWGAQPKQMDDLHVFGWQLLGLNSASHGDLLLGERTLPRMRQHLDQQQIEGGAFFGRHMPGQDIQATAIGLLGRALIEKKPLDENGLRGAKWLAKIEPSPHDAEQNLWITIAMRRASPETWNEWSQKVRPLVSNRQVRSGPDLGSWFDKNDTSASRGRVHQTALNLLTIEIYYRYLMTFRIFEDESKEVEPADGGNPFADDPFR